MPELVPAEMVELLPQLMAIGLKNTVVIID